MEVGLSLLAQSHLPTKFWVEAFMTAIYLINRTPTLVLDYVSPYFRLFAEAPDYSFLRTFGCACYPLLRPYTKHKLAFRSKQCIFLGYSSQHHGYHCLDPLSQKIYISRNVALDELNFPARLWSPSTSPVSSSDSIIGMSFDLTPFYSQFMSEHVSNNSPENSTEPPSSTIPSSPLREQSQSSVIQPPPSPIEQPHSPLRNASLSNDNASSPPPIQHASPHHMVTRSRTGTLHPKQFPDFHLFYSSNIQCVRLPVCLLV